MYWIHKALISNIFSKTVHLVDQKLNDKNRIFFWSRRPNGPVLCGTVCIMSHLKDVNLSFYADAANSLYNFTLQRTSVLVFMQMQLILLLQKLHIYSTVAQFLGFNMKALGSEYSYIPA